MTSICVNERKRNALMAVGTFVVAPLELRRQGAVISRRFCSLMMEGGAWTAGVVADES